MAVTHTKWQGTTRTPDQHMNEIQLAFGRGYILALEDILRDLDTEEQYQPTGGSTSQLDYRAGHDLAVIRLRMEILETLESANRTLKTLEGDQDDSE